VIKLFFGRAARARGCLIGVWGGFRRGAGPRGGKWRCGA
jgi:hypothetical protein